MARIRTIKPEFWTDEAVGECSMSARLLFIAAWNFADDQGGIDRSAKQLKAQAFPYDVIDCEPLVQELIRQGLLIEYEANGRKYLHINGFLKHQKIDKPAKPRIPPYEGSQIKREGSASTPGALALEGKGREGKGVEGKERARDPQPPDVPRGTSDCRDAVAAMQAVYPAGTYRASGWGPALRQIELLVSDRGVDQADLIKAVVDYAAQQQAIGNVGTQFVLSPVKFFSDDNWLGPFPIVAAKGKPASGDRTTWRPDPEEDRKALGGT